MLFRFQPQISRLSNEEAVRPKQNNSQKQFKVDQNIKTRHLCHFFQ